jgi:signal transduction histidine kinase
MSAGVPARRHRSDGALTALAAIVVAGGVGGAIALNDLSDRPVRHPDYWASVAFAAVTIGSGLVVWQRRPDTPIGRRLLIAGTLMFTAFLLRSNNAWLFTTGNLLLATNAALFLHIGVTYPSGRTATQAERAVVAAGYGLVACVCLARATTTDFGPSCFRCPVNRLYIGGYPGLYDALNAAAVPLIAAILLAMAAVLVAKWRRSTPATRRVLAPPYASLLVLVITAVIVRPDFDSRGPNTTTDLVVTLVSMSLPLALAFGLVRGHLARAAASDLLVELGDETDLEAAARRALGDPTTRLYAWDDAVSSFRNGRGEVHGGTAEPGRRLAVVERSDRRLALIDHDAALADEPERLSAVMSAIGLALDRARLAGEVRAQLAEVASSRARILTAADAERRRIERNLHDGAQQRLVFVSMVPRRARSRASAEGQGELAGLLAQATDQLDRGLCEIRELARGLQPPLLVERGLVPALQLLVETSPVPAVVCGELAHRPAPATETTAYFVASESLANTAKHAAATSVTITVGQAGNDVVLTVADDGRGGAVITDGGGLRGLQDRVEAVGGRLEVKSPPQAGTSITARLPSCP